MASGVHSIRSKADEMFVRADKNYDRGDLLSAFRLFLSAAKMGNPNAQSRLGTMYADGKGIRPNRAAALYWYRRAHQKGESTSAFNLGMIYRDEQNLTKALLWFRRAEALGDLSAKLEIAKIYLADNGNARRAIPYLESILNARIPIVQKDDKKEARQLLKQFRKQS